MKEVKLASKLVNLTDKKISLYNDVSGEIEDFKPIRRRVLKFLKIDSSEGVYYVVKKGINLAKAKERFGTNLAVVAYEGVGRDGRTIVYLECADDHEVTVRLSHGDRSKKFAYA